MTTYEAKEKALSLRKTTLGVVVNESLHSAGSDSNRDFAMYSVTVDGVTECGHYALEDCFKALEKRLPKERADKIKRLETELAALKDTAGDEAEARMEHAMLHGTEG